MDAFRISQQFNETIEAEFKMLEFRFDGAESADDKMEALTEGLAALYKSTALAILQVETALLTLREASSKASD